MVGRFHADEKTLNEIVENDDSIQSDEKGNNTTNLIQWALY